MIDDAPHDAAPMNVDDDDLRAWLLHRLTDAEAIAAFEQRMLADDDFGGRVRALENDLIDDYARSALDADDRRDVARWLLATPADRLRLQAAVALAETIASTRAARARRRRVPRSAARARGSQRHALLARPPRRALLAIGAAVTLMLTVVIYRSDRSPMNVADDLENAPTITLLASHARGEESAAVASVTLPHAARTVRLQVEVAGDGPAMRYTVAIARAGRTVFVARDLVAKTLGPYRFVEAAPAAVAVEGDAQVTAAAEGADAPAQTWTLRARRN